jgi:DNA repair protein RecN (Recombination protein N)
MLQSLRIRNLALLEEVALDFEAGFTAVTGETGAGKSILLGALSLLAGERADKTIIRQGAPACEAEAALFFTDSRKIDAVLATLDLPPCEDGVLILKRSLPRDKAPKITVNGSLATLSALQQLGEHWVDFHGPSEPRRLLKESCQLELLDLFGRAGAALADYQAAYRAWRDLVAERERIAHETKLAPDQIAFLENQLTRIDALDLTAEAIEALERDFARMSRAQELIELAQSLEAGLTG